MLFIDPIHVNVVVCRDMSKWMGISYSTYQTYCENREGYTWCPRSTDPAEPADLDGATVGTIVVASLVGVALIGGAIAFHLQV